MRKYVHTHLMDIWYKGNGCWGVGLLHTVQSASVNPVLITSGTVILDYGSSGYCDSDWFSRLNNYIHMQQRNMRT